MGTSANAAGKVTLIMLLRLIAIGNKMPAWVTTGYQEYAKRLPNDYTLKLIEIPAEKRTQQSDIKRLTEKEGNKILSVIQPGHLVIALDVQGESWSTAQLAKSLANWHTENRTVDLLVGGPEGLAPACLQKSQLRWSLSPLTLPHPLVRIVVAEQLYRAWSILQNHPYHR
jgi:23S rRNA (pseudouridine1915-N3)-methyltransferase